MKKILLALFILSSACCLSQKSVTTDIYLLSDTNTPKKVGTVKITDTLEGLLFNVNLEHIPQGEHGFHIHENGSCAPLYQSNGIILLAGMAGAHYDPYNTKQHLGPNGGGHKGDLPYLIANQKGQVKTKFYHPHLTLDEIKNRTLVIHQCGDNYQDLPQPLGGGGGRIACGVIP